ncbi:helix-turn-helix transcriptional regulator [Streptomyces sp. NPDC059578]|uniref:helix-turn-helix transcriptional regulator n=1 Tax=Streptomyces sp. NPDC059578 TaxID=3346874 RepID=UPI0036C8A2DA
MDEDYASAQLVAMARRALAAEGIHTVAPAGEGALLPLAAKRRFLAEVEHTHGLLPLLRVGQQFSAVRSDPAVSALLRAGSPHDLLERWCRLERFTHSRHRVALRRSGPRHLVVEHLGPPGAPPGAAEDAVVLGVLTALLTMTGTQDLTVTVGQERAHTVFTGGVFTAEPPAGDSAHWRFDWTGTVTAPPVDAEATGSDPVVRTRALLATDPARRWTLGELATALGYSTRVLQRRLAGDGGFTGLLAAVRAETAADLLIHGEHPTSVIGFACGYADQPHFTRRFKHRTAMTPAAYRAAFGRSARAASPTKRRKR